eukprot:1159917-Pelagomonas_calceolata.AAC.5
MPRVTQKILAQAAEGCRALAWRAGILDTGQWEVLLLLPEELKPLKQALWEMVVTFFQVAEAGTLWMSSPSHHDQRP